MKTTKRAAKKVITTHREEMARSLMATARDWAKDARLLARKGNAKAAFGCLLIAMHDRYWAKEWRRFARRA